MFVCLRSWPSENWQPDARVQWSHGHLWSEALFSLQECTQVILSAVENAVSEVCVTQTLPVKRRRAILDAAAWCRKVLVAVAGHLHGLVAVTVTKKRKQQRTVPLPSVRREPDCMQICRAIATAQLDARQKFAELFARDPAKADSFLSKFFNRSRQFEIALADEETQKTLGAFQTAEAIAADMSARANNKFPCDAEGRQVLADLVTRIRFAGAPPTGVPGVQQLPSSTTAQLPQRYSQDEFRDYLTKICASKKSVHAPFAAIKAGSLVTDSLALQLCNLGKACGLTASVWSTRHMLPIRKAAPQMVTAITNLRPVSRAGDMSAIQDALWLSRCKPFIERYTGECQLGGKFDCVAIIVALVLHAQVRNNQGLLTYFIFADLKWAFDVADVNPMLLTCYEAGIVGLDWRLLDDFFRQDVASVVVGGCLSTLLKLPAGIPRGRRFSMHAFMASMKVLQFTMEAVAHTSATILPDFARDALEGTWLALTPAPPTEMVPQTLCASSITYAMKKCFESGDESNARRLAIHMVPHLQSFREQSCCLEALGLGCLGPLFFVDDVAAPYPDAASVDKVLSQGLGAFAKLARRLPVWRALMRRLHTSMCLSTNCLA